MDTLPCKYCQQPPAQKIVENFLGLPPEHYLECSNPSACPGWPYTEPAATAALAASAWNEINQPDAQP